MRKQEELVKRLQEQIEQSSPGDRLGSYRELARSHGVAVNTVMAAMRQLERQGRIQLLGTRGAFVRESFKVSTTEELKSILNNIRDTKKIVQDLEDIIMQLIKKELG